MRALIVDDDFTNRRILQKFLSDYGECDIAVDGDEAIEAFKQSVYNDEKYDVICLDIMMPRVSGHEVLKEVREIEKNMNLSGVDDVKIIMTTALGDFDNIKNAFREQCEAYLVKPIEKDKLIQKLKELDLIKNVQV